MATEQITIFDPRRNFQLQGFTGRGATTTMHDATGLKLEFDIEYDQPGA